MDITFGVQANTQTLQNLSSNTSRSVCFLLLYASVCVQTASDYKSLTEYLTALVSADAQRLFRSILSFILFS